MKTTNSGQKKGNRYFCCRPSNLSHNQFLTVTASEAERIEADPLYQTSSDPVRDWAYYTLRKTFGSIEQTLPGFRELPQEEGDRLQVMSDVISGHVTVEELEEAS